MGLSAHSRTHGTHGVPGATEEVLKDIKLNTVKVGNISPNIVQDSIFVNAAFHFSKVYQNKRNTIVCMSQTEITIIQSKKGALLCA